MLFIAIDERPPAAEPPNLLRIGGAGSRADQAAFLAGLLAGLASPNLTVGALSDPESVEGQLALNGFAHGVRYSCPECALTSLPLLPDASPLQAAEVAERLYLRAAPDTAFAQAGRAGEAALRWLAERGTKVVGMGANLQMRTFGSAGRPGAEQVIGSVLYRPDLLLQAVLPAMISGDLPREPLPYSLASGSITLEGVPPGLLSPAQARFLAETLDRLARGELDTGVDPLTGAEK